MQRFAIAQLSTASKNQGTRLIWLLKQQGIDLATLSQRMIVEFGRSTAYRLMLLMIRHDQDIAWLEILLDHHADCRAYHPLLLCEACILLMPDHAYTKTLSMALTGKLNFYQKSILDIIGSQACTTCKITAPYCN